MKSTRNNNNNNNNSNKSENRPVSRSYSAVASQATTNNVPPTPIPPPAATPVAPPAAPIAVAAPAVRSSPATLNEEAAMNQIHSFVRGLNKTDKDVHRAAFIHLIQSMIGKEVQVDLSDGSTVTGLLHTTTFPLRRGGEGEYFSGDFPKQVLLKTSKVKQVGTSGRTFDAGATLILEYVEIIAITANVGDLHHRAVSADFRTDSSIRKQDLSYLHGRELQGVSDAWLDPTKATDLKSAGLKEWDQFEANRLLFNVQSSFDENLYTKKLDKDSMTAEQRAKADRIASEIEKQQSGNIHVLEERGLLTEREIDEEAMYSGVIRQDYQPTAPTTVGSASNTPTHSNGHSNPGSGKNNRPGVTTDSPWERGLKLSDSAKRLAPKGKDNDVQSAPVASIPATLPAAPGLLEPTVALSPSNQTRDRLSPVRFGAFGEAANIPVKPATPNNASLESGFSKISLEEPHKPLPALTPNLSIVQETSNSLSGSLDGNKGNVGRGGLESNNASLSYDASNKTPVKEDESLKSSKLNPTAKVWTPNVAAPAFVPGGGGGVNVHPVVPITPIPVTVPAVPVVPAAIPSIHSNAYLHTPNPPAAYSPAVPTDRMNHVIKNSPSLGPVLAPGTNSPSNLPLPHANNMPQQPYLQQQQQQPQQAYQQGGYIVDQATALQLQQQWEQQWQQYNAAAAAHAAQYGYPAAAYQQYAQYMPVNAVPQQIPYTNQQYAAAAYQQNQPDYQNYPPLQPGGSYAYQVDLNGNQTPVYTGMPTSNAAYLPNYAGINNPNLQRSGGSQGPKGPRKSSNMNQGGSGGQRRPPGGGGYSSNNYQHSPETSNSFRRQDNSSSGGDHDQQGHPNSGENQST